MKLLLLLIPVCVFGFPSNVVETLHEKDDQDRGFGTTPPAVDQANKIKPSVQDEETRKALLQERIKNMITNVNVTKSEDDLIRLDQKSTATGEKNGTRRTKRQIAWDGVKKWENNELSYFFDTNIGQRIKNSVYAALEYIQSRTCIDFYEESTGVNMIKVIDGGGCWSDVGMETENAPNRIQELSLSPGCHLMGTAAHEFMHALGMIHTQQRTDRDDYLDVQFQYISKSGQGSYGKQTADQIFVDYDLGSVMHYTPDSFLNTSGQVTMVPHDERYLYTMGSNIIAFSDIKALNIFYGCNDKCPADNSAKCQNGGYPNPRNCAVCLCPWGYAGDLCDTKPAGCGQSLTATENWQRAQISAGDPNNPNWLDIYSDCTSWISAPAGKKIEVSLLTINTWCTYGCDVGGIEVKAVADQTTTSPRYCCPEFQSQPIRSAQNPTPVFAFNRYLSNQFLFEYRYVDETTPDLTRYLVPLKRFYKHPEGYHRFHSDKGYEMLWMSSGRTLTTPLTASCSGAIGSVISPQQYNLDKQYLDAECPSLKLIRAFYRGYMVLTPDEGFANGLKNSGWEELPAVGYCSTKPACGANRALRSVSAVDGSTSVYSTDSYEIDVLNASPRFKGTAYGVICYLF